MCVCPGYHLLSLNRIGGVRGDQEQPIVTVAVADSRQACHIPVDGHDAIAGRQQ